MQRIICGKVCGWRLLALGLLAGLLVLFLRREQLPLDVIPLDCGLLYRDQRCELWDGNELKLRVQTEPDARLLFFEGLRYLKAEEIPAAVDAPLRFYLLKLHPGVTSVTILSWRRFGLSKQTLQVSESSEPSWLRQARRLRGEDRGSEALPILNSHLQQPLDDRDRARALGWLALVLLDQGKVEQAKQHFEQALKLDRQSGLVSTELYHILSLSKLLSTRQRRIDQAEELFVQRQELLELTPPVRVWEKLHRGNLRFQLGDLRGALADTSQGLKQALLFNDTSGLLELKLEQATILAHLGRFREAKALLPSVLKEDLGSCMRIRALHTKSWLGILEWQASGAPSQPDQDELRKSLSEALTLFDKCKQVRPRAAVLTDQAHAELLSGNADRAACFLQQAKDEVMEDAELQWEWLDLQGQILARQNNWGAAQKAYAELRRLSASANAYESLLRALFGLANAAEHQDEQAALALYDEARTLLEERALEMPLGSGHSSFVGSYQRGTQLELDLLLRRGRSMEAFELLRRSRSRTMDTIARFAQIDRFDAKKRESYDRAVAAYQHARLELEALVIPARDAPSNQLESLQREMQEREQALLSILATAGRASLSTGRPELRPIAPREMMLTCHPLRKQWACLLASSQAPPAVGYSDGPPDLAWLTRFLAPHSQELSTMERLVILPFGAMRHLDIHLLPLWPGGVPLWSRIEVVYGMDLPAPNSTQAQNLRDGAFLFVDPQRNLPENRQAAQDIDEALRSQGWRTQIQMGSVARLGGAQDVPPSVLKVSAQTKTVLSGIAANDLFIYAGHADYAEAGGWIHRLGLLDERGILVGDILTLQRAPSTVLLFACQSGRSDEETGGQEGVGLAQAFLLAGSQVVLATVRPVRDDVAAAVARALTRRLPKGGAGVSGALLRTIFAEVRQLAWSKDAAAELDTNLAAFRIFVP